MTARRLAVAALLAAAALAGCTSAGPKHRAARGGLTVVLRPGSAVQRGRASQPAADRGAQPGSGAGGAVFGTDAGGFAAAWAGRGMAPVFRPQGRS